MALLVTARREVTAARLEQVRSAQREHEAELRAATARERTAMARELHDVAAHHLSGMAVMSAAIERLIDSDPERAKVSIREVRHESGILLQNLRRMVGLLRQDDLDEHPPAASLQGLPTLVDTACSKGAAVAIDVRRAPGWNAAADLGPIAQLAVYRMAQEALANVVIHAPGASGVVTLDDRDPALKTRKEHA